MDPMDVIRIQKSFHYDSNPQIPNLLRLNAADVHSIFLCSEKGCAAAQKTGWNRSKLSRQKYPGHGAFTTGSGAQVKGGIRRQHRLEDF